MAAVDVSMIRLRRCEAWGSQNLWRRMGRDGQRNGKGMLLVCGGAKWRLIQWVVKELLRPAGHERWLHLHSFQIHIEKWLPGVACTREGKWETIPPLMAEKLRWADFPGGVTPRRSSGGVDGKGRRDDRVY
jgi:hypothetical protein